MKYIDLNKEGQSEITFSRPGDYTVYFENISGEVIFNIETQNVNLNIFGIYVGQKNDNYKIQTVQNHIAPNSTSNLLIRGVFYDESRFYYQGLIRIEKLAQKTHAYQKNQNLMMSHQCFVDSRPYLEILANDVFCTHGSTTGRINKDQLYYLQTRGVKRDEAENLLVEGFISEVRGKIKHA